MTPPLVLCMNHVSMPITDMDRSKGFYQKLGLTPGFERIDPETNNHLLQMICPDGSFVELVKSKSAEVFRLGLSPHFGLQVLDIHAAAEDMKAKGIEPLDDVQRGASGVDWFFVADPDGHLVEFTAAVQE